MSVKREIRERYPDVTHVSPAELNAVLEQTGVQKPLLLDARSPEEYAVSHLPGAVLAPDEGRALELLRDVDVEPAREIIVYCSVGLRSSALAQLLMAGGFRKVRNLEGSIFAWANSGFPLVQGEQPASVVHPFDERPLFRGSRSQGSKGTQQRLVRVCFRAPDQRLLRGPLWRRSP